MEIQEGRTFVYDFHNGVNTPPVLRTLWINGNLVVPLKKLKAGDRKDTKDTVIDYDNLVGIYDAIAKSHDGNNAPDTETFLEAEHIYIRTGRLVIGLHPDTQLNVDGSGRRLNAIDPDKYRFKGKMEIRLKGRKQDQHTLFSGTIEAGNKVIANSGILSLYGEYTAEKLARLLEPAGP